MFKEFPLTELFEITGSLTTPKRDMELVKIKDWKHPYPYITTQAVNNGIAGYSNQYTELGNVITVDSAVLGSCFYQADNFTASDHVEKLIPKFYMTEKIALYLVGALNKLGKEFSYSYQKKRSQKALRGEIISLPSKLVGTPPQLGGDCNSWRCRYE